GGRQASSCWAVCPCQRTMTCRFRPALCRQVPAESPGQGEDISRRSDRLESRIPATLTWEAVMTSATMRRARGASQGEGYWMIVFAVALLVTVGFFNLIDGIAAIANSHVFIANAHYVVGDLRAWG